MHSSVKLFHKQEAQMQGPSVLLTKVTHVWSTSHDALDVSAYFHAKNRVE